MFSCRKCSLIILFSKNERIRAIHKNIFRLLLKYEAFLQIFFYSFQFSRKGLKISSGFQSRM